MAGITSSISPCVQVVDTYLHYFYNLPAVPGTTLYDDNGNPTDEPIASRSMYVFKLLITCPDIWDLNDASFTYTNVNGMTFSMTMRDYNGVFPLTLPENETIEVEVAWDFYFDGIVHDADGNYASANLTMLVQTGLNYCVALRTIPYLPPPPPPPPPPGPAYPEPWPLPVPEDVPGDDVGAGGGAGAETTTEDDDQNDDESAEGADHPTGEGTGSGSASGMPPQKPVGDMHRLRKFKVGGKILGDSKDIVRKPGTRPPSNVKEKKTSTKPVANIGEPKEIYFTQLYNKSSLRQKSFGPGQSFVPRIKNENNVDGLVYRPDRDQIVGKKNKVKPIALSDKTIGKRVNINSTMSNPKVDISTKEPHGANYSVDNFNSYVTKDPKAGSRIDAIPIFNYKEDNKLDSKGRPIKSSQTRKDGAASSSPKASFNLFSTQIPKDKIQAFISKRSTRNLTQTSGNQDYQIPETTVNIVDDSNVIYNGGQGLFYGVGPFETVISDEFLDGLFNTNPTKDGIRTFVTVNDASIVESDVVTPATIGIQNNSFHQTEHNCLIVLGILDSEAIFRYFGYSYINIPPRSYQYMNGIVPPGLAPGAAKVVGMVFNSNNELILSEVEDVVIAPDGYTVEGYTPTSPGLPASLSNLANDPSPLYSGRVFGVTGKRRYRSTSNTVDIIAKIPQIAVTTALDTKITAIDSASTGSSSDRYMIDGVEIFAGAHDAYLQFSTTSGNDIDIEISDNNGNDHFMYAYTTYGSNLEMPPLVFSGIANDQGYLGGNIQTNAINDRVMIQNERTDYVAIVPTTHDGYLVLNTLSGWNQTGNEITQVVADQTPYLGFDALPGDVLNVYGEGIGGNYDELILQETLLPDNAGDLPTGSYDIPTGAYIPYPILNVTNAGNTLLFIENVPPSTNTSVNTGGPSDPDGDGGGGGDLSDVPGAGECVVPGGYLETHWKVKIVSVCQRPSNPCIVDIVTQVHECDEEGNPILNSMSTAQLVEELSAFSIDSTNGTDGTWYKLQALSSDTKHDGNIAVSLPGTHNFVADMCDHFSTFFSTNSIMFKLIFRVGSGLPGGGGFSGTCTLEEILG